MLMRKFEKESKQEDKQSQNDELEKLLNDTEKLLKQDDSIPDIVYNSAKLLVPSLSDLDPIKNWVAAVGFF